MSEPAVQVRGLRPTGGWSSWPSAHRACPTPSSVGLAPGLGPDRPATATGAAAADRRRPPGARPGGRLPAPPLRHAQVRGRRPSASSTVVTRLPDPSSTRRLAWLQLVPAACPRPDAAAARTSRLCQAQDHRAGSASPTGRSPTSGSSRSPPASPRTAYHGIALTDVADRFRVELLVSAAIDVQAEDRRTWSPSSASGSTAATVTAYRPGPCPMPTGPRPNERSRFTLGRSARTRSTTAGRWCGSRSDGLIVIGTDTDDRPRLAARRRGAQPAVAARHHRTPLAVVPLSQVVEVGDPPVRSASRCSSGAVHPQILVRMGWQELGLSRRRPTPRRPVDDVLLP